MSLFSILAVWTLGCDLAIYLLFRVLYGAPRRTGRKRRHIPSAPPLSPARTTAKAPAQRLERIAAERIANALARNRFGLPGGRPIE